MSPCSRRRRLPADGRLALTSGQWVYSNAEGGEPVAGHHLSPWRRDDGGEWVVVLDHGVEHATETPDVGGLQDSLDALWPPVAPRDCPPRTTPGPDGLMLGRRVDARTQAAIATPGSDMGYTYGEILGTAKHDDTPTVRAAYVRVWLRDGVAWRVGLDMLTPVPEPPGPEDAAPAELDESTRGDLR